MGAVFWDVRSRQDGLETERPWPRLGNNPRDLGIPVSATGGPSQKWFQGKGQCFSASEAPFERLHFPAGPAETAVRGALVACLSQRGAPGYEDATSMSPHSLQGQPSAELRPIATHLELRFRIRGPESGG